MKLQKKTMVLTVLSALVLAGLLGWAFAPRPLEVETAQVTEGPFETTLEEDGRTRLRERYLVSAPLGGRLSRIALKEGDTVQVGEVLATLAPALSPMLDERSRLEADARVETASALLQRADSRIGRAELAQQQANADLLRTEPLAGQGYLAPSRLDDARRAVQAAQSELDTARLEREVARRELAQARAAVAALRGPDAGRSASAFGVRAPVSGRVLKLHQTSEAVVALGTPLLELGDTRRLEVVADLLTSDALQIPSAAVVRIDRWGGPGELAGRVRRVEPAAATKVSALGVEEQRVKVLIDLTSPPQDWVALGDGYRVGVRIVTRSEPKVLQVPVSAVFPAQPAALAGAAADNAASGPSGAAASAVFVVDQLRLRLQPVRVLARNTRQAWLADGLQAGQVVVIYPAAALRDGARVQLR